MMTEALVVSSLVLSLITVVLLIFILLRSPRSEKIDALGKELRAGREEAGSAAKDTRDEISRSLKDANDTLSTGLTGMASLQRAQLDGMTEQIQRASQLNYDSFERLSGVLEGRVKDLQVSNEAKFGEIRNTLDEKLSHNRQELTDGLSLVDERLSQNLNDIWQVQRIQLDSMSNELKVFAESNQSSLDRIRFTLDSRVKELQDNNEKKLDEMRKTVDEKLHETLEKRLGASFNVVSDRLEAVQRGLGEMQNLAAGVGDLQRVLTNVKVRGTWAEVQLGNLLDQILAPGQYEKNVRVKPDSGESVEYAVRVPSKGVDPEGYLWLPIDSKFPQESYRRVQEAADRGDSEATRKATEDLFRTIRAEAQQIHDKYINPPVTTDFAIMFLATEGLYGEALREPSLVEDLQRRYRIVIAGPTTLAAILSSFRMGFQTLAIEQRASEVVKLLGAVKTEFGKFGEVLDKLKKQLNTASRTIEDSGVRTRAIERKLRLVEQLPELEAAAVLQLSDSEVTVESDELDESDVMVPLETESSALLANEPETLSNETLR
jgi:DNA recombination protein RmuC